MHPTIAAGPVIAHRGASAAWPENTLQALRATHAAGCGWVEIDAQMTADGAAVLMHDHTLERTTDGRGMVGRHSLAQIAALRSRDPVGGGLVDAAPPRLEEALALCRELGLGMVLEIKATWGIDAECTRVIAAAIPRQPGHPLLVTSFSVTALRHMRRLRPDLPLGLACLCPPRDPAALLAEAEVEAVHLNDDYATPDRIEPLLGAGLGVAVATVNALPRLRELLEMGAHGVMTDHPEFARTAMPAAAP